MELLIFFLLFILGACIGSFLNVLVERTARGESINGRSYCESCKTQLKTKDLFPLISYISTKGQCRYCKDKLSIQYLLMESITGISFVAIYYLVKNNLYPQLDFMQQFLHVPEAGLIAPLVYFLVVISALIALFLSDLKYGMLYDKITLPTIGFVLVYKIGTIIYLLTATYLYLRSEPFGQKLIESGFYLNRITEIIVPLIYTIAGSLAIALFFLLLIVVTKGRGMGGGDVKLGFLVGLVSGWPYMLITLMISFLTGSLVGTILILVRKKKAGQTIPFGPFLIIGCIVSIFFGEYLFNVYLQNILGLEAIK